jgi:hypothetical protein
VIASYKNGGRRFNPAKLLLDPYAKAIAGKMEWNDAFFGYAVLYTALITIIGFLILAFSDFVPGILFGLLTGLSMVITLVTTLSLLPALLVKFVVSSNAPSVVSEEQNK